MCYDLFRGGDGDNLYIPRASIPKSVNQSDFLYGKKAYQRYLDMREQLDIIEKEEIEPQISLLRQRLIHKRDEIGVAVRKARGTVYVSYTETINELAFS